MFGTGIVYHHMFLYSIFITCFRVCTAKMTEKLCKVLFDAQLRVGTDPERLSYLSDIPTVPASIRLRNSHNMMRQFMLKASS